MQVIIRAIRPLWLLASVVVSMILAATSAFAGDQPMKDTLELKVMQSGFGGLSGTLYHIEPNGAFFAKSIVAGEETEVTEKGNLDAGTMIELSHMVSSADLEDLPEQAVAFTGVNPTIIEISYGGVNRSLTLPPGYQLGSGCEDEFAAELCPVLELSSEVARAVETGR
jgi:hypothetical protein